MNHYQARRINMLANRRRSERQVCRSLAKIQLGAGLPRDCTITDMSQGGVKVIAEYIEIHGGSVANSALNSSTRRESPSNPLDGFASLFRKREIDVYEIPPVALVAIRVTAGLTRR
jgi:hypothetical protein